MKLSITQENLKQGLNVVGHITQKNINLPILSNIKMEAGEGEINLTATNLEIGITHKVRGKIEEEGTCLLDAKIMSDYVNLLPNKKINLELSDNNILVTAENYKTKIKSQSTEDFPLLPDVEKENYCVLQMEEFKNSVSQVIFAALDVENKVELSGVFFSFEDNDLTMAATNSFRLAEKKVKVKENKNVSGQYIIPSKTLLEVNRIISNLKEENGTNENKQEIKIYFSENQILFVLDNTKIISRLIEGRYPNYKQIIPTNFRTKCLVLKNELLRAVKTSSLFSKTKINDVNLDFPEGKNKLIVSAISGNIGENVVEINSDTKGEDNGVVVNHQYLLEGLNNIKNENIKIELIDNNTPCIITGEGDSSYLYVIMTIRQ